MLSGKRITMCKYKGQKTITLVSTLDKPTIYESSFD